MKIKTVLKISGVAIVTAFCFNLLNPVSAFAAVINVDTTTDEDSDPGTGCSIYEAVQAANTDATYGGCTAGGGTDVINIPSGTYVMPNTNPFSNAFTVTEAVTFEGPTSGSRPVINGAAKFSPDFYANAPDVQFKNLELINYDITNWDVTYTNRDLLIDNVSMSALSVNTSCDGLVVNNVQMLSGSYLGVFADDANIDNVTGTTNAVLEVGTTGFSGTGGDDVTIKNVNFSNNSRIIVEKNGPGEILIEDITAETSVDDILYIFTLDNNDDGHTTVRRATITGSVFDTGLLYENDNTTARHLLTVEDSYFHDNDQALYATTALETSTPYLEIKNSLFKDNGTWDSAVYLDNGYVTIDRSSFVNNSTTEPGNALFSSARLNLTNSVFYGNSTNIANPNYPAGALYTDLVLYAQRSPSPQLSRYINNTFANNQSGHGAAIYTADYNTTTSTRDTQYSPVFINNLFAGNTGSDTCLAGQQPWQSPTYLNFPIVFGSGSSNNMSTDSSCAGATVTSNALVDTALTDTTTPQVGYQSEGGHTQMLKLLAGSPAIDTGTNSNCPAFDITLNARPLGSTCDIGAFETLGASTTVPSGGPGTVPGAPNTGVSAALHPAWVVSIILPSVLAVALVFNMRARNIRRGF